jgi:hypothetical protein
VLETAWAGIGMKASIIKGMSESTQSFLLSNFCHQPCIVFKPWKKEIELGPGGPACMI